MASETIDYVNHPPHYLHHPSGIECITMTRSMTFDAGNATKYVYRAAEKNGRQDLEKAEWYLIDAIGYGDEVFQPRWKADAQAALALVADHEVDPDRRRFFVAMRDGDLAAALDAVCSMLGGD